MTLTSIEREILHACRSRCDVSAWHSLTVASLIIRGLLMWNDSAFVAHRTASTTRAGLAALGEGE